MPEVALVAILDADKEGFLRSERSLIQTIGRAARHLNGKAIMYADKVTGSMQKAIDETERRRSKQIAHNELNGIVPKGVTKSVEDIMEATYAPGGAPGVKRKVADSKGSYHAKAEDYSPKEMAKKLKQLEEKMMLHAKNLEFEEAAQIRDEMTALKDQALLS